MDLTPKINSVPGAMTMDFTDAIKAIQTGKRVRRLSWTKEDYCYLDDKDGYLSIFTKGAFHSWLVNKGDMESNDWVIVSEPN